MAGTVAYDSIEIIFGNLVYSIKFGVNRMLHERKTPVYRVEYYGRYRTLCTEEVNFD